MNATLVLRTGRLRLGRPLALLGLAGATSLVIIVGSATTENPWLLRPLCAAVFAGFLMFVSVRRPGATVLLTFGFLAFLGLIRRLLIPVAGWASYDPLLLVAPAVSLFMLRSLLLQRRKHVHTAGSGSIVIFGLLVLLFVQAFNPLSGAGVMAGVAGFVVVAGPLLWFYVGREFADRQLVAVTLSCAVVWAVAAAIYGLLQSAAGFPAWDQAWIKIGGYVALKVFGSIRPFGTFASSGEYAGYLAIAVVVSLTLAIRPRWLLLLGLPILVCALIIVSSRGPVILTMTVLLVLIGLRIKNPGLAGFVITCGVVGTLGIMTALGPSLEAAAASSGNPFILHQAQGLLHPFDPTVSTFQLHWATSVFGGVRAAIAHPLGLGTALMSIASNKNGVESAGLEMDVANAFAGLGFLGGALLLTIIMVTLGRAIQRYRRERDAVVLTVIGMLMVMLGQWLNGGQYAIAPLIWFVVGWLYHESRSQSPHGSAPPPGG